MGVENKGTHVGVPLHWGSLKVPLRGLLVGVGRPENRLFLKGPACKLQTHREILGKTSGDTDCRETIEVEGPRILG